jgi:hypothetical protein
MNLVLIVGLLDCFIAMKIYKTAQNAENSSKNQNKPLIQEKRIDQRHYEMLW